MVGRVFSACACHVYNGRCVQCTNKFQCYIFKQHLISCWSDFLNFHFNIMYMGAAAHMVHHLIVNEFMCCSTSIANELQLKHDCCSHVLC